MVMLLKDADSRIGLLFEGVKGVGRVFIRRNGMEYRNGGDTAW